jgi:hypothetical protein
MEALRERFDFEIIEDDEPATDGRRGDFAGAGGGMGGGGTSSSMALPTMSVFAKQSFAQWLRRPHLKQPLVAWKSSLHRAFTSSRVRFWREYEPPRTASTPSANITAFTWASSCKRASSPEHWSFLSLYVLEKQSGG